MINVRVQIFRDDKELWTATIRDPKALASLLAHLSQCGSKYVVWDDFGHANIADCSLAIAERSGTLRWYTWGPNKRGPGHRYGCWIAPLPVAKGNLSTEGKLSWENSQADPRELAGPLPEEVAEHTIVSPTRCECCDADAQPAQITPPQILITAFDVHGAPQRPAAQPAPVNPVEIQPLLQKPSWLDRLVQFITGVPRGIEVRQ